MKRMFYLLVAVAFVSFLALPAWAGGPEETGRDWVNRSMENMGIAPEAVPEAGYLWYVDLMSNAGDSFGGWTSFLVLTNWDLSTRIQVFTDFIPTGGTPNDIKRRNFYINPNDIAYLGPSQLGFNTFGNTNWYGIVYSATNHFYTVGVLLYHTEFGLTWIRADGPYAL